MSDLAVVGLPLRVGCKFAPRLTMRRIYNKKCFRGERYQHEVANHYRDLQLQQSNVWQQQQQPTAGKRRRQLPQREHSQRRPRHRLRPLAPMTVTPSVQYRCELPVHVHYYPRSGVTYAPRGRQTICTALPPVDIYNDTLRRIRSAQSCEQLKALVQRHLN